MTLRHFQPETGINITCLIISAAAPALTLGLIGVPLGLVAAFALIAVMKAQRSLDEKERKQAYQIIWIVRGFVLCIEQMAYLKGFEFYATERYGEGVIRDLPMGLSVDMWAWLSVAFMAAADVWGYGRTAAKSRAKAKAAKEKAEAEQAEQQEEKRAATEMELEKMRLNAKIKLAQIEKDGETERVAASLKSQTEARKIEAESRAEIEKVRAETENARAERGRKEAESKAEAARQRAETTRKEAEARAETERKQAEEGRKQAELARKEAEARAERERQQAEAKRKAEEAQRLENERIAREAADRTRKETEGAESTRKHWAERAEAGRKGNPETKRKIVEEAETELRQGGKKGTRAEIADLLNVSDKTVRNWANRAGEAA